MKPESLSPTNLGKNTAFLSKREHEERGTQIFWESLVAIPLAFGRPAPSALTQHSIPNSWLDLQQPKHVTHKALGLDGGCDITFAIEENDSG